MFRFDLDTLPLAQLLMLLSLSWQRLPADVIDARFTRASRHLANRGLYLDAGERSCPVTGQVLESTAQGLLIRGLLGSLGQTDVQPTAEELAHDFGALLQARRRRHALSPLIDSTSMAMWMADLVDITAEIVVDLGLETPENWAWCDVDVVDVDPARARWLVRRADDGGLFGPHINWEQGAYLCGYGSEGVWATRVYAGATTIELAEELLAAQRAARTWSRP